MATAPDGPELLLLLLDGFQTLIDELHAELARVGHPRATPTHGFALQAIGRGASSAGALAEVTGVSKQAAARTVARLEALGYVSRTADPADARRQHVVLTEHGHDLLERSAAILQLLRSRWVAQVGERRVAALERTLHAVLGDDAGRLRVDLPGWLRGDL